MDPRPQRVAIIGNSHTLAIGSALRAREAACPNVTCFGMFHQWDDTTAAMHGSPMIVAHLLAGGDVQIALDDFDLFVVCAAGWWAGRNEHLLGNDASHPLAYVACPDWLPPDGDPPPSLDLVSKAAFEALIHSWIDSMRGTDLVRLICQRYDRPALWQPWPAPSRTVKADEAWVLNSRLGTRAPAAWLDFFGAQHRAVQAIAAEIGGRVRLLPYPLPDIARDGFMDPSLCEADPFHGNEAYGALVLEQIKAHIA